MRAYKTKPVLFLYAVGLLAAKKRNTKKRKNIYNLYNIDKVNSIELKELEQIPPNGSKIVVIETSAKVPFFDYSTN